MSQRILLIGDSARGEFSRVVEWLRWRSWPASVVRGREIPKRPVSVDARGTTGSFLSPPSPTGRLSARPQICGSGSGEGDEARGMATGSGAGNLRLIEAATVSAALQGGATDAPPDVIALLQSYPGQWSEAAVEALHGAWPLARLVMLLGSWCEGETRTGHPCCGVWRLFWYEFVPALERHLAGAGRATDSWGLPRLATAMERLAWDVERLAPPEHRAKGLVVVAARSLAAYEAWEDACAAWGYATVWQRPGGGLRGQGACAGIWDAADPSEGEWREMSAFARRWSPARILFALGFPRLADALRAERLGARLLSKPTALPDLWWNLEQATRPTATIVSTAEVTAVKSLDDVTTTRLQSPELLDVD